ncbi:MAG: hypothetical protein QGH66_00520 [Dehalococcoidia bacterium]|nr:hypothetical protein [Dehalococcoidia bacterium]
MESDDTETVPQAFIYTPTHPVNRYGETAQQIWFLGKREGQPETPTVVDGGTVGI